MAEPWARNGPQLFSVKRDGACQHHAKSCSLNSLFVNIVYKDVGLLMRYFGLEGPDVIGPSMDATASHPVQ